MNIKNRLKTIERKINREVSAFCLCYGINLKREVVPITIDEWKRRFACGEDTHTKLPDFCERCRKLVNKTFIETTFEQTQKKRRQTMKQVMETMNKFNEN